MMGAVRDLLLETLNDLSTEELTKFKWLLQFTFFQRSLPLTSWSQLQKADKAHMVGVVVERYGQQSLEVAKEIFMDMDRTDLVQRLSETSSGPEEKHCVDENWPALTQKVESMASVIELLLETLTDLSDEELDKFRCNFNIPLMLLEKRDRHNPVFSMVLTYGEKSMKEIKQFLKEMRKPDLAKRLSDSSSGPKNEHRPALIHKVATMAAVKQLLLETLKELSQRKLKKFKDFLQLMVSQKNPLDITPMLRHPSDRADTVDLMVTTFGQQSVEVTREILKKMNKTRLMQRLSKPGSGLTEQLDEHQPALPQKETAIVAVKQALLKSLNDLRKDELEELKWLLQFTYFRKGFPHIPWSHLKQAGWADALVHLMVKIPQAVAVTKEVLMDMNRTDLAERLSETSSGLKDCDPTILDKLAVPHIFGLTEMRRLAPLVKRPDTVFIPKVAIMKVGFPVKISCYVLIYKTNAPVLTLHVYLVPGDPAPIQAIDKTEISQNAYRIRKPHPRGSLKMKDDFILTANVDDAKIFPESLRLRYHKNAYTNFFEVFIENPSEEFVLKLIQKNEHRPVWTCVIRKDEYRSTSHRQEEHQSKPIQEEVTRTQLQEKLLETLEGLKDEKLKEYKWYLLYIEKEEDLPRISRHVVMKADSVDLAQLTRKFFGQQTSKVTREALLKMNRRDLEQRWSEISSGSKGPSRSLEQEGSGGVAQVSSDWTKLDPEVNSTDADEAPTYILQSEAGNFECSVSALRWFCKENISFRYQFCSLKNHMERIESMQYMPASPLMDITVIAGKFDEVYLPHWICVDDNPTISDKFAVLHIDDCGDVVEKVSEVTSSHVKLSEPAFSLKMILVKVGFSVEINCKVLIYGTRNPLFKLHVYLIPPDVGLLQDLDKAESSDGCRRIRTPHPRNPLKMHDWFTLTAELDGAEIATDEVQFLYESIEPNFSEVIVRNPETDLTIKLKKQGQPVWTYVIHKEEYQIFDGPAKGEHFVDKHRAELIDRVSNIKSILDQLLAKKVIQQERYDEILAIPTTRDQMRKLYSGPLNAAGHNGKEIFYKILEEKEKFLIIDLKKNLW